MARHPDKELVAELTTVDQKVDLMAFVLNL